VNVEYSKNGLFVHPNLALADTCVSIYHGLIPMCTGDRVCFHKINLEIVQTAYLPSVIYLLGG